MTYVDLNPIRAGIAATPEGSEFASVFDRIRELKASEKGDGRIKRPMIRLRPFASNYNRDAAIPYALSDYLELVDWTGRRVRDDKRGFIDDRIPAIAQRLNIDAEAWSNALQPRGNVFGRAMGKLDHMRLHANTLGQSWVRGLRKAAKLYA